jgi:hypothetical protein
MSQKPRRNLGVLSVAIAVLTTGCAMHTPERVAGRFINDIRNGIAQSEGSPAFDRARVDLHLTERRPEQTSNRVYSRSAARTRRHVRIGLASSNVLQDPPDRFDLRLSWAPARPLRKGLVEKLLGPPYGISATGDNGWIILGGILEYRTAETETPYLLFSSPAYIRDPLDFLEAGSLPHLPSLESISHYLERNARERLPRRVEGDGYESRAFHLANGLSLTVYSGIGPQKVPYLAGLTISIVRGYGAPASAADFLPILRDLCIPAPEQLVATISGAKPVGSDAFAAYNNFAIALSRSPDGGAPATDLTLWRRIESPQSVCEHLRPDLERCSSNPQ